MPHGAAIKPTHKAIQAYYAALQTYKEHEVRNEGALETAFQRLLADTGRSHGWTLLPKQPHKKGTKHIIPDGTFQDEYNLLRGFWEAKDADDDLDDEIRKKTKAGYPLTNIIFEDTRRAVLYQNGIDKLRADLTDRQQLADLLNDFYGYTEPHIEDFEQAVGEFKDRIPDLAKALDAKIKAAHKDNKKFQAAFAGFFELCKQTLNPNISEAAVDEMLVQHLLTERLITNIFDNADFIRRNVIAAEVEKVIDALVSKAFNRHEFLKSLDRFYLAIEAAARTMEEFADKQHFLNTVYERFFQGNSVKLADTHGIVYTPQPIVEFMCASVAEVLEKEFGKKLGDPGVNILDPCTGTGNFIVNLLRRIPKKDLPRMYREQLFANEVMLLPYYIAALNIEHAHYELTGKYEPFEGLCFVDTLDLAEREQGVLSFLTEANTARVQRQKKTPITVIIGNPPYNAGQVNENDNNKNRKYDVMDTRIKQTFAKDSKATLKNKLYDPYVRFFRWAIDRLQGRPGIVCFVSNNNFVHQLTFDGLRKHMLENFMELYHVDLHGNVRENPKLSGSTHNVFGIKVGVGITLAIRTENSRLRELHYHRVPEPWRKEQKLSWLSACEDISGVKWKRLAPRDASNWIVPASADAFAKGMPLGSKEGKASKVPITSAVFKTFSGAVKTNRDDVVYDFDGDQLCKRIRKTIEDYNAEVDRYRRKALPNETDDFVDYKNIKWSSTLKAQLQRGNCATFDAGNTRRSLYRPFVQRYFYFDDVLIDRPGLFRRILPLQDCEAENRALCIPLLGFRAAWAVFATNLIPNYTITSVDGFQCFPFYTYTEDGTREIAGAAMPKFRG